MGSIVPETPTFTIDKTAVTLTSSGYVVNETWKGPASTRATFVAAVALGTAHGTYTGSRLKSVSWSDDDSGAAGDVTRTYEPPTANDDIAPSGSSSIEFSEEQYTEEVDVNPLTPSDGKKTVHGTQYVFRVTSAGSFTKSITNIAAETQTGSGARPSGVSGGDDAKWSCKLESLRDGSGVTEKVMRHVYRP